MYSLLENSQWDITRKCSKEYVREENGSHNFLVMSISRTQVTERKVNLLYQDIASGLTMAPRCSCIKGPCIKLFLAEADRPRDTRSYGVRLNTSSS